MGALSVELSAAGRSRGGLESSQAARDHPLARAQPVCRGPFSISTEKRDLYVLPALPTFAVLIALAVGGILWSRQEAWSVDRPVLGSRWLRLPQGVAAGVFVLAGVAGAFVARREAPELSALAIGLTAVCVVGAALLFSAVLRGWALAVV